MTSEIVVTVRHAREAGLCARGQREWARAHNLDFGKFINEGLPISVFEAIDDPYARQIVEFARHAESTT